MTTGEAKKLIAAELKRRNVSFEKMTAKTVSFSDLARGSGLFVSVKGVPAQTTPELWDALRAIAKQHGFFVQR